MLTGKQRSFLRGKANKMDAIFQVGKDGVHEMLVSQLDDALEARELIKINVLSNSPISPREALDRLGGELNAEPVQSVGAKIVLYRRSRHNPTIILPRG